MRLRPVTFRYKHEYNGGADELQYGLIAEEVAEIDPSLVLYGTDGQPQTVRYHFLTPILLNEVQKQQRTIDEQKARIESLEERLSRLEQMIGH